VNHFNALVPERTPGEWRSGRRYMLEFGIGFVAFLMLMIGTDVAIGRVGGPLHITVALLPTAGVLAMALALVRFTLRMDELQRQTVVTAAAIAAAATAVVSMALALIEDQVPFRLSLSVVLPMLVLFFGIALPFVGRRHQ
jgi:hypothetical protein